MKILLCALGSRGDVQPFLALAVGLQQAGHQPTLAAPATFTDWIEAHRVAAHPLSFNPQDVVTHPDLQALAGSRNVVRQMRLMRSLVTPGMVRALDDYWRAVPAADFIIQTGTGLGGVEAATVHHLPLALAFLQPFAPTRAFPSFFLPLRFSLGRGYNWLTHYALAQVIWLALGAGLNQWRRKLGLIPLRSFPELLTLAKRWGSPTLYGYSPSVLPRPADWDANQYPVGYWFLEPPPGWQPPAALVQFLESGPPPVYIGFGSMRDDHPERLTRTVLRALELSGQRGVLLTGWGGLQVQTAGPQVFFVDNVPHAWLLPRMAAVLHHGGAGTTAAGLRAGVPNLILPFALDQFAWADLVAKAGVGPRLPTGRRLTAEKLAEALRLAVNDPGLRARAAALGARIRAEDGLVRAVEIIERHAAQFKHQ